ncbi:MAG: calcium-binding protein [Arenibacterium sp.]
MAEISLRSGLTYENLNHRISEPVIRDSKNGPELLSGTRAFATAFMQGGIQHEMVLSGDFEFINGDITGTLTGLSVSFLGFPTYSISDISVDAKGYIDTALSASFGGNTVFEFFGSEGAFGSGAPGITYIGGRRDNIETGSLGDDVMQGKRGDDTLSGDLGDDLIEGQLGNDTLSGGAGLDTIKGGSGNDEIYGNENDDMLFGGGGGDLIDGGSGNDTLNGGGGFDILRGGFGDDIINGGGKADRIDGGEGADMIDGGLGGDTINGDAGRDVITGGRGGDTINGGMGDDTIKGGVGQNVIDGSFDDDRIDAGKGNDIITGGEGNDVFLFNAVKGDEMDIITDYDTIQDQIRLKAGAGSYTLSEDSDGDALLSYNGRTIEFQGVTQNELIASLATYDEFG